MTGLPRKQGLYDPQFEHEACGVGFVVNIKGRKSHTIIEQALQVLLNLDHRGACGCEANTGDGAGILLQTPHAFFKEAARSAGVSLPSAAEFGVGMVYLPHDPAQRAECETIFAGIVAEEGQRILGWRTVPTRNDSLGATAKASEPFMRQVFVGRNAALTDDLAFERKLYIIRKRAENAIRYSGKVRGGEYFYLPSLSFKTVVYKGMLMPAQVAPYYPDLTHPA
ncbi:MAG: glutamate synthase subunit alpha, partial [Verrucomicrobiota bacterium]